MAEEVGSLRVGLALDSATFDQSLKSVDRNLKALGQEMAIIRARGSEWGNSIEGLSAKQGTLSAMLESQDVKVRKLNEAYQKAVTEQGANSTAAENLAIQLNRATAEMTRTETELGQVTTQLNSQQAELEQSQNAWNQLSVSMEETGTKLQATGEKMKNVGGKLSAGITAPLLAVGAGAVAVAIQFDESQAKIQAALGVTSEEADKLKDSAQAVWKDGFGESLDEVTDALIRVKQNMKGVSDSSEIEKITRDALSLAKAFDSDVNEVTRAGNNLMKAFGTTSEESFDLMASGAQNGLNFSNEMFDNLSEYSGLFGKMGFSAEEYFQLLVNGSKEGVYNLDYINDVMKENQIRLKDGSKLTSDSMSHLSKSTQNLWKEYQKGNGTVKDVSNAVLKELKGMDDQTLANNIGVGLYGTKWEDLEAKAMYSLTTVGDEMGNVTGTMDKLAEAQDKTFGQRWNETLRTAQSALLPVGEILLDIAEEWLPKLSAAAEDALQWFEDLGEDGQKTALAIAGIAAAAGPALVVFGSLTTGVGGLLKLTAPLVASLGAGTGLAGTMAALTGPVGLTIAGVGLLTAAVVAGVSAYQKANEVNIEVLEAKQQEIAKNDELIASFDGLQNKNRLSNDEMLRFLDINAELRATDSPAIIAALKDEQAKLLEKSTLTNVEMDEFLALNQEVIETAPGTVTAISSQGEAYALNTEALKELNAEEARRLEAAAKETLSNALEKEKALLTEQKDIIAEINENNVKQQETRQLINGIAQEIKGHESNILDLQKQKNGASDLEILKLDNKIRQEQEIIKKKQSELDLTDDVGTALGHQLTKLLQKKDLNADEIKKLGSAKSKYEEIILAQVGLNSEKGKGLVKIDQEISKLNAAKGKLGEQLAAGKINTQEYQNQIGKIDTQISKLATAKSKLDLINTTAGETIYKTVQITESPKNIWNTMDQKLGRSVSKTINLGYKYPKMGGPLGNIGNNATGTRYAPGGLSWVGEEGPELMYLPTGSRIVPNEDSAALLNKWNIPTESSKSSGSNNIASGSQNISIAPAPIYLDGQVIAEVIFDTINNMQYKNTSLNAVVRGVSL
jgi:phage-related minor tail protein